MAGDKLLELNAPNLASARDAIGLADGEGGTDGATGGVDGGTELAGDGIPVEEAAGAPPWHAPTTNAIARTQRLTGIGSPGRTSLRSAFKGRLVLIIGLMGAAP